MTEWVQIRDNRIRLIIEADSPPPTGVWLERASYTPQPEVGWFYDRQTDTFKDLSASPIPDNYRNKAIELAKQAKPGLLNPEDQAQAIEGIRKGIAAILLLLLKTTDL